MNGMNLPENTAIIFSPFCNGCPEVELIVDEFEDRRCITCKRLESCKWAYHQGTKYAVYVTMKGDSI